jgi:hypothetical protein
MVSESGDYSGISAVAQEFDVLFKSKFYLLSAVTMNKWLLLNGDYLNTAAVKDLKDQLLVEYNHEILPLYNGVVGSSLKTID